jgi:hypothetical protein
MVTSPPERSKPASRAGRAVISVDVLSTATCPNTSRCSTSPRTRPAARVTAPVSDQRNGVPSCHRWPHGLASRSFQPPPTPVAKTRLKLGGINQHEHATKGVVRRNAMLQRQEASQPPFLTLGILRDVFPTRSRRQLPHRWLSPGFPPDCIPLYTRIGDHLSRKRRL